VRPHSHKKTTNSQQQKQTANKKENNETLKVLINLNLKTIAKFLVQHEYFGPKLQRRVKEEITRETRKYFELN
jgi:hypothetical protein